MFKMLINQNLLKYYQNFEDFRAYEIKKHFKGFRKMSNRSCLLTSE